MPLETSEVDIEARKRAGRDAAITVGATEPKTLRDGLEQDYPYTYWWWFGWNQAVADGT